MKLKNFLLATILMIAAFSLAACDGINITVKFHSNGGNNIKNVVKEQGSIIEEPEVTRAGYTFLGWFESSDFDEATKVDFTEPVNRNLTIYAKWQINSYQITFEPNNGEEISSFELEYDERIPYPTLIREGYDFLGWYRNANFSGNAYSKTKMPDENLELFARWEIKEYTVTFLTAEETVYRIIKINYGEDLDKTEWPTPPDLTGKNTEWEDIDLTNITENKNVKLVVEDKYYTVRIIDDEDNLYLEELVIHGTIFNLPTSQTKEGFNFVGYSNDLEFEVTEDITIEVYFTAITYNVNVVDHLGTTTTTQIRHGDKFTAPSLTLDENHLFIGWFLTSSPTVEDQPFDFNTAITEEKTIYAIIKGKNYQITLNANGGLFSNSADVFKISEEYDKTIGIPEEPTREYYTFIGWYFNEEGTGTQIIFSPETRMEEDLELYACWEETTSYRYVKIIQIYQGYEVSEDQKSVGEELQSLGSQNITISNIWQGTEFSPNLEVEGYLFRKYVYNDVEYLENDLITITDDYIEVVVYYERIINEITFIQRAEDWVNISNDVYLIEERYVEYNNQLDNDNIPSLNEFDSYDAIWEKVVFLNVRENLIVSALYLPQGEKTIIFKDGGKIIFMASQEGSEEQQFISKEALLWNISKPGYQFDGWFIGDNKLEPGDYAFIDFESSTSIINIISKWTELTAYDDPTDVEVAVIDLDDDEYSIVISWMLDLNDLDLPNYNIIIDRGEVIDLSSDSIVREDNQFSLTIETGDDDFNKFSNLLEVGLHIIEIQAMGDNITTTSSAKVVKEFIMKSIFDDEDPDAVAIYDYFIVEEFKETKRYIFYTNMTYQFNSSNTIEILSGNDLVSLINNDYTIKTENLSGSFRFKLIKENNVFTIYEALIVKDIRQFTLGSNYQGFLDEAPLDVYHVGSANDYYLDIRMRNTKGDPIIIDDVQLEYQIYINNNGTYDLIDEDDYDYYLELKANNKVRFKASANNETFKIIVNPKYQSTKMQAGKLEFIVAINDGYNAFNNQDLKELYQDFHVHLINIHADIKAELSASQLNSDGSPINKENGAGNVYNRNNSSNNEDEIIIEGNYMTIDGSNLPFSNARSGSGDVGFGSAFEIVNVQIGIFNYNAGQYNADPLTQNESKLTINNLTIIGNTTIPEINYGGSVEDILIQERLMSMNSGGHIGIKVRNGSSEFNNVEVKFTVIGFMNLGYGENVEMVLNEVKVSEIWANSFYMQGGSKATVNDSYFGGSGGPTFHLSDIRPGDGIDNPTIVLNNTIVNNYVSGQEAWFKAYNMSSVALGMKSTIEDGIAATGRHVIKTKIDPVTGLETEMINLILLTEPRSNAFSEDENNNKITGPEVVIIIDGIEIARPFNILTSGNPRVSGRQFASPVGPYSEDEPFLALLTEINTLTGGMLTPEQSANLAALASFYNVSAEQVVDALTAASFSPENIDLTAAIYENYSNGIYPPQYLEIVDNVPIFGEGNSVIIVGLEPLN